MKLNELTTLNKHPIIQRIRELGDTKVHGHQSLTNRINNAVNDTIGYKNVKAYDAGSGSFSHVYLHKNGDSVLKIYHDPAYDKFIDYAKSHQDDPHLPKIYHHAKTPDGIGVVHMEKLEGMRSINDQRRFSNEQRAAYSDTDWHANGAHNGYHLVNSLGNDKEFQSKYPTIHKSLTNLGKHFENSSFDFHSANMMHRNGTLVWTDPIVDMNHLDHARRGTVLKEMMTLNRHPTIKALRNKRMDRDALKSIHLDDLMGSGTFGDVYNRRKDNSVIKYYQNDPAYSDFIKHIKNNPDNPYLPKIHRHIELGTGKGIVKAEKLTPISPWDDERSKEHPALSAFDHFRNGISFNVKLGKDYHDALTSTVHGKELQKYHPEFHKTLVDLASNHPEHQFDFASANFMERKNSDGTKQLVVNDPFYSDAEHMNRQKGTSKTATYHPLRLDELTTLNKLRINNDLNTRHEFTAAFKKNLLGKGTSGAVFSRKNPDKVVKVYSGFDIGYENLLHYSKRNPDDPHLPKIHHYGTLKSGDKVVSMEKLSPIFVKDDDYQKIDKLANSSHRIMDIHAAIHDENHPNHHLAADLQKSYPSLHDSFTKMINDQMSKGRGHEGLDSFSPNYMRRKDGTLVINDILEEMMTLNKFLQKYPNAQNDTKEFVDNVMDKSNKVKLLGSGVSAHVYSTKRPNKVYKVYKNHDTGYSNFVEYAKKNQDDPHIPKVYGHAKLGKYSVAALEKLKPIAPESNKHDRQEYIAMSDLFNDASFHEDRYPKTLEMAKSLAPSLVKSADKFIQHNGLGKWYDMHDRNIMKRKDGTKVITDPLEEMITLNKHPVISDLKQQSADPVKYSWYFPSVNINDTASKHLGKVDRLGVSQPKGSIGSGVFGTVFENPKDKNTVYKVYRDRGYDSYINWAKQNQDNPHVPKIYAHRKIDKHGLGVVKMERLRPLDDITDQLDKSYVTHANSYVRGKEGHRLNYDIENNDDMWKGMPETYVDTLNKLAQAHPQKRLDLHGGNLMKRISTTPHGFKKTDVVITDPFADTSTQTAPKLTNTRKEGMDILDNIIKGVRSKNG